jgi:hypothetical protein
MANLSACLYVPSVTSRRSRYPGNVIMSSFIARPAYCRVRFITSPAHGTDDDASCPSPVNTCRSAQQTDRRVVVAENGSRAITCGCRGTVPDPEAEPDSTSSSLTPVIGRVVSRRPRRKSVK